MNKYQIISYVKEEMLANPYISDQFAWDIACLAEDNGDAEALVYRWMEAETDEEKYMIERVMEDLLKARDTWNT